MQQIERDDIASKYPHLTEAFATMPDSETHLRRLQDLNASWQNLLQAGVTRNYTEVVVSGAQQKLPDSATFDIIYAGGGLNLLHAAVMTMRYHLRVLVFDRFTVGAVHREWNISREELRELLEVGLLTSEELATVMQREYSSGLVRFSPKNIRVQATELHLHDVLNIAIDAEKLTALCMQKILAQQPHGGQANVILHTTNFVRATVTTGQGVSVEVTGGPQKEQQHYKARLLVDGMGSTSPIACQLNCGRPFSLVCPTVGTVARGYKQGKAENALDPDVGEVLVSTEDARKGRQYIWEAFPGSGDNVAIYLFYYAQSGDRVDLLELFDDFFALLPAYKDTSTVEMLKPVYGFIPAGYNITLPWQKEQKVLAYDHVISLGDAAAFQSPLTFCGFGSYVRNLRRVTTLLYEALQSDCLEAGDLKHIRAAEAVPAVARAFSKFMIGKSAEVEPGWQVNETLNVFCRVLADLGPEITNAFFKDRISWLDYTRLVLKTPGYYPRIYGLAMKTLSPGEIIGWISAWLQLGGQEAQYQWYCVLRPIVRLFPVNYLLWLTRKSWPRMGLRMASWQEGMEQIGRGREKIVVEKKGTGLNGPGRFYFRWPLG